LAQRQSGEVWVINSERGQVRAGTSRGPIPTLLFFRLMLTKLCKVFVFPLLYEPDFSERTGAYTLSSMQGVQTIEHCIHD